VARQELTETIEANQASAEKIGAKSTKGIALLIKNSKNTEKIIKVYTAFADI
jgi:hypothetical protein